MVEHREQSMSALSHRPQNWHQIDWCRVQRTVRAMQIRIAKACKNGNWRKVKALQRALTRSTSAKFLAVRRVTENRGNKTVGIDGKRWTTPQSKWNAAHDLERRGYRASPLRRVFIPKSNDRVPGSGVTEPAEGALRAKEDGHRGSWLTLSLRRPNTHQRNHDDQAHYRIDRVG